MSRDEGSSILDFSTARGRDYPSIRQFSIFSPNTLGQLQHIVRLIESHKLRVCSLSVSDSAECAIIRLVVTHPERAYEILQQGSYKFCETDLLVVELPDREQPILAISNALLQAEININYCMPLLISAVGAPAMAFHVDDHEMAADVLKRLGFTVLSEADLEP